MCCFFKFSEGFIKCTTQSRCTRVTLVLHGINGPAVIFKEIQWKVMRQRWGVVLNICLSRKAKDDQWENLLSLPFLLLPLRLLMAAQQPQWHFTQFLPCTIMHLGDSLAFGCRVFNQCLRQDWPARLQSRSLSLIISEFINTHLIATLRRDLNHLHTKIAFFCSGENSPLLHNY